MNVLQKTPNRPALILYLDTLGIDARRVKIQGADATGYDYIQLDRGDRPMQDSSSGTLKLVTKRVEWPDDKVWPNVQILLAGGGLNDIEAVVPKKEATRKAKQAITSEIAEPKPSRFGTPEELAATPNEV